MTERLIEAYPCDSCNVQLCYRQCYKMTRWAEKAKEKLAEYETAEEEGRLVVLPCKVGDTVYLIDDIDCVFERESIVTEIEIDKDGATIMIQDEIPICSSGYNLSDFGEIVFLTREEAEKALKEMKKNE